MRFQSNGHARVSSVVSDALASALAAETAAWGDTAATGSDSTFGTGNIPSRSALVRKVTRSTTLTDLMVPGLRAELKAARGAFFDKTAQANWPLAWHQDRVASAVQQADPPASLTWAVVA